MEFYRMWATLSKILHDIEVKCISRKRVDFDVFATLQRKYVSFIVFRPAHLLKLLWLVSSTSRQSATTSFRSTFSITIKYTTSNIVSTTWDRMASRGTHSHRSTPSRLQVRTRVLPNIEDDNGLNTKYWFTRNITRLNCVQRTEHDSNDFKGEKRRPYWARPERTEHHWTESQMIGFDWIGSQRT